MKGSISSPEIGRFYTFGHFRLDPAAKVLFCDGEPVPLTPKVFDTLQFLVEHSGRLLEKDELMQAIWQDRFVEESNLAFNIKVLRRALQDDPNQPRFIETIRGRGYRLIAEVEQTSGAHTIAPVLHPTSPEVVPAPRNTSYLSVAVIAVLITGTIFSAGWFGRSRVMPSLGAAPILSKPFESEALFNSGNVHALITPD